MAILFTTLGLYALLVLIAVSVLFLIALMLKDNSIMDIAYGPIYTFASIGTLVLTKTFSILPVLITICITIWAIRLGGRIFMKNIGKPEDARYAAWRKKWLENGKRYFIMRSYFQIYILQGLVILAVSTPVIISVAAGDALWIPTVSIGLLIFCLGLGYETIADLQLDNFLKRKKAGAEESILMTKGLFKFSRRPNYFGETLVWWGFVCMVISLPFGWTALLSPILITYIVTRVTGPMLEEQFLSRYPLEYSRYMATTNYFIPGKPKSL